MPLKIRFIFACSVSVIAFDKVVFEGFESAIGDGLACLFHEAQVEMQIVQGKQP